MVKFRKRKYDKKKKKSYKSTQAFRSVISTRGGFSIPVAFGKTPTLKDLNIGSKVLLGAVAKAGIEEAERFVAGRAKNISINVGKTKVKLATEPTVGGGGGNRRPSPLSEISSRHAISGSNHLFTAHKHKWNVNAGRHTARWIKNEAKQNGDNQLVLRDTLTSYHMDNVSRSQLSKDFGFNQKLQWFINASQFGVTADDLRNQYTYTGNYDSSKLANQICYLGISKLRSIATITNMNRYVPCRVKVSLVDIGRNYDPKDIFAASCNAVPAAQDESAMPMAFQYSHATFGNVVGDSVLVDVSSPGVRSSNTWKDACSIAATKTFRLAAGDHLEVDYEQRLGSGLRLDKLFGYEDSGSNYVTTKPITYALLIEAYGEQVELVDNSDQTKVMKGTCIGNLQCEFKKMIYGPNSSYNASTGINSTTGLGSNEGWYSHRFPLRVISRATTENFTINKYNLDHNLVDGVNYSIPIMSDAVSVTAGTNT